MNRRSMGFLMLMLAMTYVLSACGGDRKSGRGLSLPEGDAVRGRLVFIDMGCTRCHTIPGAGLPDYAGESPVQVALGGEVLLVKTYGELITSITNPDHVVSAKYLDQLRDIVNTGESGEIHTIMPNFNDRMTVSQLIDVVTFLDNQYTVRQPDYRGYRYGSIPPP